jgi:hypothetical protein
VLWLVLSFLIVLVVRSFRLIRNCLFELLWH